MKIVEIAAKILLPIVFIAVGVGVLGFLMKTKPEAAQKPKKARATLVEVAPLAKGERSVKVHAVGTLKAAQELTVSPEVSGQVIAKHEALVRGGTLAAGEQLLQIDDREYAIAVREAGGAIAQAQLQIKLEKGNKRVAEREWRLVKAADKASPEGKALALREPQLKQAKAALSAAQQTRKRLALRVEKTSITVPFNAFVREESVEVGQVVGPSSRVATLVGTDQFWVEAAIPMRDLAWIQVPGVNTDAERGSVVTIRQDLGDGASIIRQGYVLRLLQEVEPTTRMAKVLVAVDKPLDASLSEGAKLPLLIGRFVQLEIEGKKVEDVYEIPRVALRDGDSIYTMTPDKTLAIRAVEVVWREREAVLVRAPELGAQEQLITGRVAAPVPGMALRLPGDELDAEKGAKPPERTAEAPEGVEK